MLFCGIDPSSKDGHTGIAFYDDIKRTIKSLTFPSRVAEHNERADVFNKLSYAEKCVIEMPRLYGRHPRPNDLITLAVACGEFGGKYENLTGNKPTYVFPSEWKRQLDKDICWQRVLLMLNPTELNSIANVTSMPKYKRHDVQDAIGLALFAAGRKVF